MSTPARITTTPVVDTSVITRATERIREALQPFVDAMKTAARFVCRLDERIRQAANDPVYVAGLEARYYVRAGLDSAYRTREGRDALIRGLLSGDTGADDDGLLGFVSPENRRLLAVAAISGWVQAYPYEAPFVAHRLWGSAQIQVCTA